MPEFSKHPIRKAFRRRSIPERKEEVKQHVAEQLTEIYENDDGSMPDMKHIEKRQHRRARRAFVVLLLSCAFFALVAWVGFFVFPSSGGFEEDKVILSISGPESLRPSEEARYRIRYRNDQPATLENAIVQVRYPEGFVFSTSSPVAHGIAGDEWSLGTIEADESGFIDIIGRFYGDVGSSQSFRVFLSYTPQNFSSEFQTVATASIGIVPPFFDLSLQGPSEIVSGAGGELTIAFAPKNEVVFEYIAIDLIPGSSFIPTSPVRWLFDSINSEQKITVAGVFAQNTSSTDPGDVKVVVRGWKEKLRSGDGYIYGEATYHANIIETALHVAMIVNGTTGNMPVQPGDILNVSVVVKNDGDTPVDRVGVRAVFEAPSTERQSILDWKAIDDSADGDISGEQVNEETRRGTIFWDARHIGDLKRLDPGEEVAIDFHLPIKDTKDTDLSGFTTTDIIANAEIEAGVGAEREVLTSIPLRLTVVSDVSFAAEATVDQLDDGREVHVLSWVIKNSFHELSDIVVETEVYGDVSVNTTTIKAPAGVVEYDTLAKKLRWTIPQMPTVVDILAIDIPIVVNKKNPTQTQLTSQMQFLATDVITGEKILKAQDGVALE